MRFFTQRGYHVHCALRDFSKHFYVCLLAKTLDLGLDFWNSIFKSPLECVHLVQIKFSMLFLSKNNVFINESHSFFLLESRYILSDLFYNTIFLQCEPVMRTTHNWHFSHYWTQRTRNLILTIKTATAESA